MTLSAARPAAATELPNPVDWQKFGTVRVPAAPTQIISFAIDDDQYGVDIMAVREIKG